MALTGGGSENLIVDYQGVGNQYAMEGKLVIETPNNQQPSICMATQQGGAEIRTDNIAPTLTAAAGMSGNNQPVYCGGVDCRNVTVASTTGALQSSAEHNINSNNTVQQGYIVRRLTPLECERLQGFPDGWTDIGEWVDSKDKPRKPADSARYKALGNSIALPPWFYVLAKLSLCCGADKTMASLFDGIGGFPLIWQTLNGEGTCLWASEIEDFPIAVTQQRFNDADN